MTRQASPAIRTAIDELEAQARDFETKAGVCRDTAQQLREAFGISTLGPVATADPVAAKPKGRRPATRRPPRVEPTPLEVVAPAAVKAPPRPAPATATLDDLAQPRQNQPADVDAKLLGEINRVLASGASYDVKEIRRNIGGAFPELTAKELEAVLDQLAGTKRVERISVGSFGARYRKRASYGKKSA